MNDQTNESATNFGRLMSIWAYRVNDCGNVADFLAKYYKTDRYTGRGEEYAAGLLASYQANYDRDGFTFISRHDSKTGEIVALFLDRLTGQPVRY
jgi:hypothetical protein